LIISEDWFGHTIDINDINVESDIQKFTKFFLSLLFQVKLPLIVLVGMDGVLVLMPGVSFKCVEHIVVSCHKIIVVVKFMGLLC
jgi:ABC-type uncharacterized transport system fused permease/ATPase subunit